MGSSSSCALCTSASHTATGKGTRLEAYAGVPLDALVAYERAQLRLLHDPSELRHAVIADTREAAAARGSDERCLSATSSGPAHSPLFQACILVHQQQLHRCQSAQLPAGGKTEEQGRPVRYQDGVPVWLQELAWKWDESTRYRAGGTGTDSTPFTVPVEKMASWVNGTSQLLRDFTRSSKLEKALVQYAKHQRRGFRDDRTSPLIFHSLFDAFEELNHTLVTASDGKALTNRSRGSRTSSPGGGTRTAHSITPSMWCAVLCSFLRALPEPLIPSLCSRRLELLLAKSWKTDAVSYGPASSTSSSSLSPPRLSSTAPSCPIPTPSTTGSSIPSPERATLELLETAFAAPSAVAYTTFCFVLHLLREHRSELTGDEVETAARAMVREDSAVQTTRELAFVCKPEVRMFWSPRATAEVAPAGEKGVTAVETVGLLAAMKKPTPSAAGGNLDEAGCRGVPRSSASTATSEMLLSLSSAVVVRSAATARKPMLHDTMRLSSGESTSRSSSNSRSGPKGGKAKCSSNAGRKVELHKVAVTGAAAGPSPSHIQHMHLADTSSSSSSSSSRSSKTSTTTTTSANIEGEKAGRSAPASETASTNSLIPPPTGVIPASQDALQPKSAGAPDHVKQPPPPLPSSTRLPLSEAPSLSSIPSLGNNLDSGPADGSCGPLLPLARTVAVARGLGSREDNPESIAPLMLVDPTPAADAAAAAATVEMEASTLPRAPRVTDRSPPAVCIEDALRYGSEVGVHSTLAEQDAGQGIKYNTHPPATFPSAAIVRVDVPATSHEIVNPTLAHRGACVVPSKALRDPAAPSAAATTTLSSSWPARNVGSTVWSATLHDLQAQRHLRALLITKQRLNSAYPTSLFHEVPVSSEREGAKTLRPDSNTPAATLPHSQITCDGFRRGGIMGACAARQSGGSTALEDRLKSLKRLLLVVKTPREATGRQGKVGMTEVEAAHLIQGGAARMRPQAFHHGAVPPEVLPREDGSKVAYAAASGLTNGSDSALAASSNMFVTAEGNPHHSADIVNQDDLMRLTGMSSWAASPSQLDSTQLLCSAVGRTRLSSDLHSVTSCGDGASRARGVSQPSGILNTIPDALPSAVVGEAGGAPSAASPPPPPDAATRQLDAPMKLELQRLRQQVHQLESKQFVEARQSAAQIAEMSAQYGELQQRQHEQQQQLRIARARLADLGSEVADLQGTKSTLRMQLTASQHESTRLRDALRSNSYL